MELQGNNPKGQVAANQLATGQEEAGGEAGGDPDGGRLSCLLPVPVQEDLQNKLLLKDPKEVLTAEDLKRLSEKQKSEMVQWSDSVNVRLELVKKDQAFNKRLFQALPLKTDPPAPPDRNTQTDEGGSDDRAELAGQLHRALLNECAVALSGRLAKSLSRKGCDYLFAALWSETRRSQTLARADCQPDDEPKVKYAALSRKLRESESGRVFSTNDIRTLLGVAIAASLKAIIAWLERNEANLSRLGVSVPTVLHHFRSQRTRQIQGRLKSFRFWREALDYTPHVR